MNTQETHENVWNFVNNVGFLQIDSSIMPLRRARVSFIKPCEV